MWEVKYWSIETNRLCWETDHFLVYLNSLNIKKVHDIWRCRCSLATHCAGFFLNPLHITSYPLNSNRDKYRIYVINQLCLLYKYIYIYIYVWKLNQTVLELDFRAVKFLFFPRRDLNPHHCYTASLKKGASIVVVLPCLVWQI